MPKANPQQGKDTKRKNTMRISYKKIKANLIEWLSKTKLTEFSFGVIGIGWETAPGEKEIGEEIITFMEPRRALYAELESNEFPSWVSISIIEIRNKITDILIKMPKSATSDKPLRKMRDVCNTFLSKTQKLAKKEQTGEIILGVELQNFYKELADFREEFGYYVAILVSIYEVDVEDKLASIFPFSTREGKI